MLRKFLLAALLALVPSVALAAPGTIYFDTGGSATNSGTSDTASPIVSGTATVTCAASVCTFTGSPDLSGVATDGSQAIYLACATNTNQKIFWITSSVAATSVTVTGTPAGCGSASNWAIGGQMVFTPANWEAGIRPGDTVQFNNSPATRATTFITARVAGDQTGYVTVQGKAGGSRPLLSITSGSQVVIEGGSLTNWRFKFLQLSQTGSVANCLSALGLNAIVDDVKISACPGVGITTTVGNLRVINSEVANTGADGILNTAGGVIRGTYVHDTVGDCIEASGTSSTTVLTSVLDTCGARGINFSSASVTSTSSTLYMDSTTIYGSGGSGIRFADGDWGYNITNSIVADNGNAASEYNIDFASPGALLGQNSNNIFYHSNCQGSGTGGPSCVNNFTLGATDIASNPLFTNAAGGDFTLQSGSPARAAGFPGVLLGGGSTGYRDIGALQHQDSGGASGAKPGIFGG